MTGGVSFSARCRSGSHSAPLLVALPLAAAALVCAPAASAKGFAPGDLRVCNAKRCVAITDRVVLRALGSFYYHAPRAATVPSARIGAPSFELRFENGYVTGIVASPRLDRFLSYGVNVGHFLRGRWYRVPTSAALELRRLTARLQPLRVTPAALRRSR
jgi:hypothetical protein